MAACLGKSLVTKFKVWEYMFLESEGAEQQPSALLCSTGRGQVLGRKLVGGPVDSIVTYNRMVTLGYDVILVALLCDL